VRQRLGQETGLGLNLVRQVPQRQAPVRPTPPAVAPEAQRLPEQAQVEQARAEQARAEQARAEQARVEQAQARAGRPGPVAKALLTCTCIRSKPYRRTGAKSICYG